jgi:hypothetical protein
MFVIDNRLQERKDLPKNPTYEQAKAFFNFRIDESLGWSKTKPGESCWKIVGIEINTGILVYRPLVLMENGKPNSKDKFVICRHNNASPIIQTKPAYFNSAHVGWTETGGDKIGRVEFDTHVMQDGQGPDSIWVAASPDGLPPQHSDLMTNLGWNGSTNHDAVSPIFQWIKKEDEPMTKEFYLELFDDKGKSFGKIVFKKDDNGTDEAYYVALKDEEGNEIGRVYFK